MNYRERVGKNINHYRKVNDLTLKEVAKRVGITEATMQKYEVGQIKRVDIEMIEKIADAIGTTASKITGWLNQDEKEEAHEARVDVHKANADAIGGITKNEAKLIRELRKNKSFSFPKGSIVIQEETDPEIEKAKELYKLYQKADPRIQKAVESLLKDQ